MRPQSGADLPEPCVAVLLEIRSGRKGPCDGSPTAKAPGSDPASEACMKRLLAATDLSSGSDRAVRRAAELARVLGAQLFLLHVVEDDQPASVREAGHRGATIQLLEQTLSLPGVGDIEPQILVRAGGLSDSLMRATETGAADLVVMGAPRRRPLRAMLVGTTVERVLRQGSVPVLTVMGPPTRPYRRILAAVELDGSSARALRVGAALGLLAGADLTVLHAFWLPGKVAPLLIGASEAQMAKRLADTARDARIGLGRFLGGVDLAGAPAPRMIVEEGRPATVIKGAVRRLRPEVVLMGTGQRGALSRLFLGSVAEEVLSDAACDVLVVPPAGPGVPTPLRRDVG
jgi:universal stress protein E